MSKHRADTHRADRAAAPSASSPRRRPTRRTAPGAHCARSRRRFLGPSPSLRSLIGGGALIAAAVGLTTAGHAISAWGSLPALSTTLTASQAHVGYVADLSSASPDGRDAVQVSRSGVRPAAAAQPSPTTLAERQAQARAAALTTAASHARRYARRLASDTWVLPTSGFHITVWFGEPGPYWSSGYHTGIDFATAYGTPAVAVDNATVRRVGWDGAYGNQVRLRLENGDQVWYNHLSAIEVTRGETVAKRQEIGRIGDTGNAYGFHLHLEYHLASDLHTAVDPRPYFVKHDISLR